MGEKTRNILLMGGVFIVLFVVIYLLSFTGVFYVYPGDIVSATVTDVTESTFTITRFLSAGQTYTQSYNYQIRSPLMAKLLQPANTNIKPVKDTTTPFVLNIPVSDKIKTYSIFAYPHYPTYSIIKVNPREGLYTTRCRHICKEWSGFSQDIIDCEDKSWIYGWVTLDKPITAVVPLGSNMYRIESEYTRYMSMVTKSQVCEIDNPVPLSLREGHFHNFYDKEGRYVFGISPGYFWLSFSEAYFPEAPPPPNPLKSLVIFFQTILDWVLEFF